ncbi:MAG TPA: addiction module protein, partial [Gemmataceae bacterium]|nr:addiction module protein [Gemmataceae bacterium]
PMSATIEALGIDKLPVEEQLALVRAIWDNIAASGPTPRLTDAQRVELRRRVAEDDARPDDLIPWEQVKADARKRIGG